MSALCCAALLLLMVYYFTSSEGIQMYMGKDKFENEELIKHGFDEDVWFHVDSLSSAHVYLRLPMGASKLDDISAAALEECTQLVKANSIEGCKKDSVSVCWTKWKNLKKTAGMDAGTVTFHRPANVRRCMVPTNKEIVKALNRTKTEVEGPDLEEERRQRELLYKAERKEIARVTANAERVAKKKAEADRKLRAYDGMFVEENMTSNASFDATEDASAAVDFEDDFM